MRKELYGAEPRRRRLAVTGACELLRCGALTEEDQVDLLVALRPLLSGDPRVADDVYAALDILIRNNCGEGNCTDTAQVSSEACTKAFSSESSSQTCPHAERLVSSTLCHEARNLIIDTVTKRFDKLLDAVPGTSTAVGSKSPAHLCKRGDATLRREARTGGCWFPSKRMRLESCFEVSQVNGKSQVAIFKFVGHLQVSLLLMKQARRTPKFILLYSVSTFW